MWTKVSRLSLFAGSYIAWNFRRKLKEDRTKSYQATENRCTQYYNGYQIRRFEGHKVDKTPRLIPIATYLLVLRTLTSDRRPGRLLIVQCTIVNINSPMKSHDSLGRWRQSSTVQVSIILDISTLRHDRKLEFYSVDADCGCISSLWIQSRE